MKRLAFLLPVLLLVLALVVVTSRSSRPTDAERVQSLSEQLRCPVCDGLSVADSPSSTARAIAADVQRRVAERQSDQEIRDAYVAQYGTWILLAPPASGIGAFIWFAPIAGVAIAGCAAVLTLRRRSGGAAANATDAIRLTVDQARQTQRTRTEGQRR